MQIRNLQVFCDVVHRGSFSKAAADNAMTQSGASQAVQQLEEYLQVQLIDRSKRPFQLTAEGLVFHPGCLQIVRQLDSLTEEIRAIGQEMTGRASIAAIYSVGLSYLPRLQQSLRLEHPKSEVRYQFGQPDEVYRLVEQGAVDFGLVSYPQSSKKVCAVAWCEEPMVLAAASGHALSDSGLVPAEDLTSQTLVAFAANLRIRHEIDRYLRQLGITMQIAAEFDNIDSVKHGMEVHRAVAFLPRPAIQEELADGSLIELPCPWLQLSRPIGIIQRRADTLGRTARGIFEMILADGKHNGGYSQPPTSTASPGLPPKGSQGDSSPAGDSRSQGKNNTQGESLAADEQSAHPSQRFT